MNPQNKTIAIIGLGYVGLPLAVEFGKHRATLGFDINQTRINELQSEQDHTLECSPEELQSANHLRYSANTTDLQTAQIYIVTVPTPVDQANRPDMTPLVKASETVVKVLKASDVVIYESTVYPGATEEVCVPVFEKFSGLKFISSGSPRSVRDDNTRSLRGASDEEIQDNLVPHGVSPDVQPVFRDFRAGDVRHSLANTSKANRLMSYTPTHRIEEGISSAIRWYVSNLALMQ